jgi:hypothetical protein
MGGAGGEILVTFLLYRDGRIAGIAAAWFRYLFANIFGYVVYSKLFIRIFSERCPAHRTRIPALGFRFFGPPGNGYIVDTMQLA